ncbi:hypothetical protein [Acidovorax sp. NCPPB 3576]|nr:hypothetical protein [Acidovorax sp. NCPPB 3576]
MSVYRHGSPRAAGRGEQAPSPLARAAASTDSTDGATGAAL